MTATRWAPTYESVRADLMACCGTTTGSIELGSAGPEPAWAEALLEAPLRPGDRVLMTRAGDDSARVADLAAAHGFDVVCCDVPAGESTSLWELMHLLWWDPSIRAVVVVRDETSTGATCDPADVREVLELTGSDALLLVDCRASLGVTELHQDVWGADLLVATTGPGLGVPGLTVLSRSARACAGLSDGAGRPVVAADDPRLAVLQAALDRVALEGLGPPTVRPVRLAEGVGRGLMALGLVLCARVRRRCSLALFRVGG